MTTDYIQKAEFNPKVCTYWLLSGIFILTITVVGIPLLLLWIPLGMFFTRRYLSRMECLLTSKSLIVNKGVLFRIEKTIPLEKITDMGMAQGPIMRSLDLHRLSVETAGQSGPGALVSLTGIVDVRAFREAVLTQRDALSAKPLDDGIEKPQQEKSEISGLLSEIRDSLIRIEAAIGKQEDTSQQGGSDNG
ncbi:MAG: PH domain-containing protein [Planctomycetota bacterium]|jgi:putative membrane protein